MSNSREHQLVEQIDEIAAKARRRWVYHGSGAGVCEYDYMTQEEREELHKLQMELAQIRMAAREKAQRKVEKRRRRD